MTQMLEFMVGAAKKAGLYMSGATEKESTRKSNAKDFVTVADIKSQDILREELQRNWPDVVILSEEDPEDKRKQLFDPSFTGFVLDPIDGTYNFKRDMREPAISIGYIEQGDIQCGVVYDPYKDEMYHAEQGSGAFRNGEKIAVSGMSELAGSSIATSNSYDDEAMARNLHRHISIYEETGIMPWTNCPGSGVLIMAYVACGRFDAYHHNGLKPWDNAAAFLIVREAGGKVVTLKGEDAAFTTNDVIIGTPLIVDQLLEIFKKNPELQQ